VYLTRKGLSSFKRKLMNLYQKKSRGNSPCIQAYFHCVLKSSRNNDNVSILKNLLSDLEKINTDVAQEMFLRATAEFYAFNQNDESRAINTINDSIRKYPESLFSKFAKFEISEKFKNIKGMEDALQSLEFLDRNSYFFNAFLRARILLLAHKGEKDKAYGSVETNLKNFPSTTKLKIRNKIEQILNTLK